MTLAERRQLVERYLAELRAQRDVDVRDVLEELIHVVLEVDDDLATLREHLSRIEEAARGPGG